MATQEALPPRRTITDLPPRYLNPFTQLTILFGGFTQQFGWIFFSFGMVFFWIFAWNSSARYWWTDMGRWETTAGQIISREATNASQNERRVYRYMFEYELNGKKYFNNAYASGNSFERNEKVTVRYKVGNPKNAYVKGTRRAMFGGWVLIVAIFPVVGLILIIKSIGKNWRFLKILKIGTFTTGVLTDRKDTGGAVVINNRHYPVYDYRFEFEHDGQTYFAKCKTHHTHLVEDESREIILYDQFNPNYNLLYDAVPNTPAITAGGYMAQAPLKKGWVLLLPIITLIGNGWYIYYLAAG